MEFSSRIGFIGMGNMGRAIAQGFARSGMVAPAQLYAYAPHQDRLAQSARAIGFTPCASLAELAASSDVCILCCKPYQIEEVLQVLGEALAGKALLCVAAGWSFARFAPLLGSDVRVQCIMPNTPAMVGEGVLLFEQENSLAPAERAQLMELFGSLGLVHELPARLMGIGGTITGCGPAFVDLFLEAFADAAVKYGIPRAEAYALVSQMVLGSAKLQLETAQHPGVLKDAVCSPGGTTIKGVCALERAGLRAACMDAVDTVMNG